MNSARMAIAVVLTGFVLTALGADGETISSKRDLFAISYEPDLQPLQINTMHRWVLHIETHGGEWVEDAEVTLIGGMPDHDHGLPTVPQSTRYLGEGDYLVEGMKFHMNGRWVITITIDTITADGGGTRDTVVFEMQL